MADISKIKLPDGNTYDIKDAVARTQGGGSKAVKVLNIDFVGTLGTSFVFTSATFNGESYSSLSTLRTALNDYKTAHGLSAFNVYVTFNGGELITSTYDSISVKTSAATTYSWSFKNSNLPNGITGTFNTATTIGTSGTVTFNALTPSQISNLIFNSRDFDISVGSDNFGGVVSLSSETKTKIENGNNAYTMASKAFESGLYKGTIGKLSSSSAKLTITVPDLASTEISGKYVLAKSTGFGKAAEFVDRTTAVTCTGVFGAPSASVSISVTSNIKSFYDYGSAVCNLFVLVHFTSDTTAVIESVISEPSDPTVKYFVDNNGYYLDASKIQITDGTNDVLTFSQAFATASGKLVLEFTAPAAVSAGSYKIKLSDLTGQYLNTSILPRALTILKSSVSCVIGFVTALDSSAIASTSYTQYSMETKYNITKNSHVYLICDITYITA